MAPVKMKKCTECREGHYITVVEDYTTEMEHDGRIYNISIPQIEIKRCDRCRSQFLPDGSFEVLLIELRKQAGLMSPAEIRGKREQLGLSQKQFAKFLDIAPATVSRWESGGQIQQRTMNALMDAFFQVSELRDYLMNKHRMFESVASQTSDASNSNGRVLQPSMT